MKKILLASILAISAFNVTASAVFVNFTYNQSDSATGSGFISAFTFDNGGGPINFSATPLPAATVRNPVPASTPAGFVGAITGMAGNANEADAAVGLLWSGFVIAQGMRGTDLFTIQIPLLFVPKQTQVPDINDYTWNVAYGDVAGSDAVSTGALTLAFYLSRDTTIDGVETANTFQRYTQDAKTFVAGVDTFTNTDTTTPAIKDAVDGGAPLGTDAAGRDLGFYFAWRQAGALSSGAILVGDFTVGGLVQTNDASLSQVPEPSAFLAAIAGSSLLFLRRRRR